MGSATCMVFTITTLSVAFAIAVIAITADQLANTHSVADFQEFNSTTCLLGSEISSFSLCNFAYAVGGISLAVSLVIALLQIVTCGFCGCGPWLDLVFSLIATAWWTIASLVFSKKGRDANTANLPQQPWRNTVIFLSWAQVVLFGIAFGLASARICCGRHRRRQTSADEDDTANLRNVSSSAATDPVEAKTKYYYNGPHDRNLPVYNTGSRTAKKPVKSFNPFSTESSAEPAGAQQFMRK